MSLPIGFFAPLPLPMMIPFMGMQSAVMAEQFGTLFQYGKRRISAMSNDEFNALTPEILQQRMTGQLQAMIPEMEKQIQSMSPLVSTIIREFANYIKLAITAVASPTSGFEQITQPAPIAPSPTGSSYVQGPDGKTYYYENGVLISIDGVPVGTGTITEPILTSPAESLHTITVGLDTYTESSAKTRIIFLRNKADKTSEDWSLGGCPTDGTGSTWCQNMYASLQRDYQELLSIQQAFFDKWGSWP